MTLVEPLFPDTRHLLDQLARSLGLDPEPPGRQRKPQDDIWDACGRALRWVPEPGDEQGRKRFGRMVAALHRAGANPSSIADRAGRYRAKYPTCDLTPEAFVKHWSAMAPPSGARPAVVFEDEIDAAEERISLREWRRMGEDPPTGGLETAPSG